MQSPHETLPLDSSPIIGFTIEHCILPQAIIMNPCSQHSCNQPIVQLAAALKYTDQFGMSQTCQHRNMVCFLLLFLLDYVKCALPFLGFADPIGICRFTIQH
jgi:hypothetical protein